MSLRRFSLALTFLALAVVAGAAELSPLAELLARKGLLTEQELRAIEGEGASQPQLFPRIGVGSWVRELDLFGDVRLRWQWDKYQTQLANAAHDNQFNRWRFRLRLNAEFKLAGNFFGGVTLQTVRNADSTTQTYTQGFDNYGLYLNRAYLGWRPVPGFTVVAGKQSNPLYTTDLIWDPAVSPQGLVERIDFDRFFDLSFGRLAKTEAPKDTPNMSPFPLRGPALSLISAQFIFSDNDEYRLGKSNSTDSYQFVEQLLASYHSPNGWSLTIAPELMAWNAAHVAGPLSNGDPFADATIPNVGPNGVGSLPVVGETKDELYFLFPGDFSFKIGKVPVKLYWDGSYNLKGADRFDDYARITTRVLSDGTILPPGSAVTRPSGIYGDIVNRNDQLWHASTDDRLAYLVGLQVGDNARKGDFSAYVNWRQQGLVSMNPNLPNSDFGGKRLNMQGFVFGWTYNVTDYMILNLNVFLAWNLTSDLYQRNYTDSAGQIRSVLGNVPVADRNVSETIHLNLLMKF